MLANMLVQQPHNFRCQLVRHLYRKLLCRSAINYKLRDRKRT